MNKLKMEKQIQIIHALTEGNSIRSTERMIGVHRDTVMRVLNRTALKCTRLMDEKMRGFHSKRWELDEIYSFVGKKEQRLNKTEKKNISIGDQYIFVALDADTKLIPTYAIGKRTTETTIRFIRDFYNRVKGKERLQITTDGFRNYLPAIEQTFGADVDFAQQVKYFASENPGPGRYAPPRVSEVVSKKITGNPNERYISTAHVESHNLTMRMCIRRLTRLCTGYSKKLENLKSALALYFCHYNFVRVHSSLKVTPTMEAGITDHIWNWGEILAG